LHVSARRGYASPSGRTSGERRRDEESRRAREARRAPVTNTSPELRDALNAPLQQSGLTFTVHAAPFRNTAKDASVALAVEFDGGRLPFTEPDAGGLVTNTIELSFFGINEKGKAQRATRTQFNLTLRPESMARVKSGGLRVNPRLALEPGRYQIRVGARESVGGRVGTVFYDLLVPDFGKERLTMSGVLVTAASAPAAMTAMPDPAAPKLLPGPAVSRRTFTRNDTVTVFAEIYDNISGNQARQIDTVLTLASERGQDVFNARDSVAASPGSGSTIRRWTTFGFTRDIPLTHVAPGQYLLKVEAKARGDSAAAMREILITVQ
jgi:hypothetical protein